jgi:WD40 repeat protein
MAGDTVPQGSDFYRELEFVAGLPPAQHDAALADLLQKFPDRRREVESWKEMQARGATPPLGELLRPTFRTVGPYEVGETLGWGGMGIVYAGYWREVDRRDAVKVILPRTKAHAEVEKRFRREIQLHDRLAHPGIAKLHQIGFLAHGEQRLPWLSMELVDGARTLIDFADDRELDVQRRLELFLAVVDAVAHAHERGVLHRDLKPSNVLVGSDGRPKLIDFGIARDLDDLLQVTRTGEVHGTPDYMAPEQRSGTRELDARCDVFSLGVILYELACGRLPFSRPRGEAAAERVTEPGKVRADLPRGLAAVMLKSLQRDPARRYATAGELAADLRAVAEGRRPRAAGVRAGAAWALRRASLPAAAAAVLALSLWWVQEERADAARTLAAELGARMQAASADYDAGRFARVDALLAPLASRSFAAAELLGRARAWREAPTLSDGAAGLLHLALAPGVSRAFGVTQSGIIVSLDLGSGGGERSEIRTELRPPNAFGCSSNGELLAVTSPSGVGVWRLASSHPAASDPAWFVETEPDARPVCLAFDPSDRWLVVGSSDGSVTLRRSDDGKVLTHVDEGRGAPTSVAFAPGGRRLAISYNSGFLSVRQVAGEPPALAPIADVEAGGPKPMDNADPLSVVAFAAEDHLAVAGHGGLAALYVLEAGKLSRRMVFAGASGDLRTLAISEGGQYLAAGGTDGCCHLFEVVTGKLLGSLTCPGGPLRCAAFLGPSLVVGLAHGGRPFVWSPPLVNARLSGHRAQVRSACFSLDGTRIASTGTDESVRVWDAATLRTLRTMRGHANQVLCVAWSDDGRTLVSGATDHKIAVWDAETGERKLLLEGHDREVQAVACLPGGERILSASRDGTVRQWDQVTGEGRLLADTGIDVWCMALAPDASRVCLGGVKGEVAVVELMRGEILGPVKNATSIHSVQFAVDGQTIAAGGRDGSILLFDAMLRDAPRTFAREGGIVWGIVFTRDGTELLTAHEDGSLRVWATASGELLASLRTTEAGKSQMGLAIDAAGARILVPDTGHMVTVIEAGTPASERALAALRRQPWPIAAERAAELRRRTGLAADARAALAFDPMPAHLRARVDDALVAEGDDPDVHAFEALDLVWHAGTDAALVAAALKKIRYARKTITPWRSNGLAAVEAAAQHRLGDHRAALDLLEAAPDAKGQGVFMVLGTAVSALANQAVGAREKAAESFARLKDLVSTDRWRSDADALALLREVEQALR